MSLEIVETLLWSLDYGKGEATSGSASSATQNLDTNGIGARRAAAIVGVSSITFVTVPAGGFPNQRAPERERAVFGQH